MRHCPPFHLSSSTFLFLYPPFSPSLLPPLTRGKEESIHPSPGSSTGATSISRNYSSTISAQFDFRRGLIRFSVWRNFLIPTVISPLSGTLSADSLALKVGVDRCAPRCEERVRNPRRTFPPFPFLSFSFNTFQSLKNTRLISIRGN